MSVRQGAPVDELASLVSEVGSLFERAYAPGARRPTAAEVEELLADGHELELALEDERSSVEQRISDALASPRDAHRLRSLGVRHAEADRRLTWLRSLLAELREYGLRFETGPASSRPGRAEPSSRSR